MKTQAAVDDNSCQYDSSIVFSTYPWLSLYANFSECDGESVTVYDAGSYNFILIKKGNESKLYFENGTYYCDETLVNSCVAAYGLTNISESWTCEKNTPINGCTDSKAFNYNPAATANDDSCRNGTVFELYPWLSANINQSDCSNQKITAYDAGNYHFIYVESENGNQLYYQDGTFYCQDLPNYSCLNAYNLSAVDNNWSCGGNQNNKEGASNFSQTKIEKARFKLYPNPAKNMVNIETDFEQKEDFELSVYNIQGKQLDIAKHLSNKEMHYQININHLPKGIYIVEVRLENETLVEKLIVE